MSAIRVTDKNLNVQKASEGEVSFRMPVKKPGYTLVRGYFDPIDGIYKVDRFPVDDEHSQNKI